MSAKLLCVFSTLTAPNEYADWHDNGNGVPVKGESVLIKGGAGVANENILTPRGVATMVTEKQVAVLRRNPVFILHEKNGFVAIDEVPRPPSEDDVENAAAGLASRDGSAPLVEADFLASGEKAPTTGTATPKGKRR
jgi:hypothetical protein